MKLHLVKIAGMFALSAATVAGMSLVASTVQAAEEEENIALSAETDIDEVDEGAIGESEEAIHRRGWRRYPGRYFHPGYRRFIPPGHLYRHYRPYSRYYRPYYSPYYSPYYYPGRYYYGW